MIEVYSRYVATETFPAQHITGSVKGGLALMDQKFTLTKLRVVFGSSELKLTDQDSVYVTSDQYAQVWAKKIYELGGKSFVLVPVDSIVLTERK